MNDEKKAAPPSSPSPQPAGVCPKCGKPKFGPTSTMCSADIGKVQSFYCGCGEIFTYTVGAASPHKDEPRPPDKVTRQMRTRNDYQLCPKCGTRWYANEVLPCPKCEAEPSQGVFEKWRAKYLSAGISHEMWPKAVEDAYNAGWEARPRQVCESHKIIFDKHCPACQLETFLNSPDEDEPSPPELVECGRCHKMVESVVAPDGGGICICKECAREDEPSREAFTSKARLVSQIERLQSMADYAGDSLRARSDASLWTRMDGLFQMLRGEISRLEAYLSAFKEWQARGEGKV